MKKEDTDRLKRWSIDICITKTAGSRNIKFYTNVKFGEVGEELTKDFHAGYKNYSIKNMYTEREYNFSRITLLLDNASWVLHW